MKACLPLVAPLALLACATPDDRGYPSLAPRAAEGQGFAEPVVAPPAPAAADPALDVRLAQASGKLDGISKGFDVDAARTEAAARRAGAQRVGSEAWLGAQAALAGLDDWRAQATGLATELEQAAGERAGEVGTPYPALDALRERAAAEAERQSAAITRIGALLPAA